MTIIATAHSRHGGRLDCGHCVAVGEAIVKVDTGDRGRQTAYRNGPGSWVCVDCAARLEAGDE